MSTGLLWGHRHLAEAEWFGRKVLLAGRAFSPMSLCKARAGLLSCVTSAVQRDPWNHCFLCLPTLGPHWVLLVVGLNSLPRPRARKRDGWPGTVEKVERKTRQGDDGWSERQPPGGPTLNLEGVLARCGPCGVAGCTLIVAIVIHLRLGQAQGARWEEIVPIGGRTTSEILLHPDQRKA